MTAGITTSCCRVRLVPNSTQKSVPLCTQFMLRGGSHTYNAGCRMHTPDKPSNTKTSAILNYPILNVSEDRQVLMAVCIKSGQKWCGTHLRPTGLSQESGHPLRWGHSERLNKTQGCSWQAVTLPSVLSAFFGVSFACVAIMRQLILAMCIMWAAGMLGDSEAITSRGSFKTMLVLKFAAFRLQKS